MTDNANVGLRLENAINERGIKYEVIANKLGITRKTFHRKLMGEVDFKLREAIELIDILRLTETEVKDIFLGTK